MEISNDEHGLVKYLKENEYQKLNYLIWPNHRSIFILFTDGSVIMNNSTKC